MKKFKVFTLCAAVAVSASAQQLPNVGFEEEWVDCCPWTSITDTLSMVKGDAMGQITFGKQPQSWIVSDVLGVVSEKDGGGYGALGTTEVASKVAGYNSESALKLTNNPNPFMATQIVPAYVSLGKAWATNTLDFSTFSPANKDGGVFGGMAFAYRPDALAFDYTREFAEGADEQVATVLVYAWKGTWTQEEVPGNNSMSADVVKTTMIDRDRNILGMATSQGGAVSHSDDAELIAKSLQHIEGSTSEWVSYLLPIDYLSAATPEKINVVLAANDYFDSDNIVNGNSLTVDNVRFVYYSRLESVKIDGVEIPDFSADVYDYTFDGETPAAGQVETVLLGQGKSAVAGIEIDGNQVKITVSNENGADIDGAAQHVYTITCQAASGNASSYDGSLNIEMLGGVIAQNQPATIHIVTTGANTCTISLPNFTLDLGGGAQNLGDIVVPDVRFTTENGIVSYEGSVDGLSLLGGEIIADVTLTGTIDSDNKVNMLIHVMWNEIPIVVTFSTEASGIGKIVTDNNAPVEYYDLKGMRINGKPDSGIYIRRQGNSVSKIFVK